MTGKPIPEKSDRTLSKWAYWLPMHSMGLEQETRAFRWLFSESWKHTLPTHTQDGSSVPAPSTAALLFCPPHFVHAEPLAQRLAAVLPDGSPVLGGVGTPGAWGRTEAGVPSHCKGAACVLHSKEQCALPLAKLKLHCPRLSCRRVVHEVASDRSKFGHGYVSSAGVGVCGADHDGPA